MSKQLGIAPPKPWFPAVPLNANDSNGFGRSAQSRRNRRLGIVADGDCGVEAWEWYAGAQYLARYGNVDFSIGR